MLKTSHIYMMMKDERCLRPLPLILDPATASDHPLVSSNVLVNLPAEVFLVGGVSRAGLQEVVSRLGGTLRAVIGVVEEGVGAQSILVAVADITVKAGSCVDDCGEE